MRVKIVNKSNHRLPEYATPGSAGMDLKANTTEPIVLKPLERQMIPTGIHIQLPEGYEAQIRPRSGLAAKYGITVTNTPGTVEQHQAVVKQGELLENPEEDNQQPSIYRNIIEGSTTNSRVLTENAEDSNANTSALPNLKIGDDIV